MILNFFATGNAHAQVWWARDHRTTPPGDVCLFGRACWKAKTQGPGLGGPKGKEKAKKKERESRRSERRRPAPWCVSYYEEFSECFMRRVVGAGGWRRVYAEETARGRVLLLTCTGGYVQALDTGEFRVGEPREDGKALVGKQRYTPSSLRRRGTPRWGGV